MKLTKMNVSTFDTNILNWYTFWQQFNMAIHSKTQLDHTEKLVCLRNALKDGPAKHVIESLTHDAECYKEAIDCLWKRYNQPHIIHRAHTRAILDTHSLRSNSKELWRLHDVTQQHLHALKMMKYETFALLITSTLELKLDQAMMFEWQWHTHNSMTVPDYDDLLELLDLCAKSGGECGPGGRKKKSSKPRKEGRHKTVICSQRRR